MANYSDEDNAKINSAKKKYDDAKAKGDTAGMAAAHNEAEAVRANYGISGGADGSQEISIVSGNSNKSRDAHESYSKGTSTDYGTYEDDARRLSEAQKKYQIAQLKSARDTALANLDTQEQQIKPTYQNARNMTSASSQTGARSFAEYLANRGLQNSGAAAQGEMNRLSSLQNNLGGINTAEANAYRDIANQRTQVNNDYANGMATANAQIEANYLNNLLNYNEQQRQYVQNLKNQAVGQYANDYQAYMDTLDPNSMEYLYAAAQRGNKVLNNYTGAYNFNNSMANIRSGNWNYNDLLATGLTQNQAAQEYNNAIAQAQAQAEQQAFENYIKEQQLRNDTLQTQYNVNKPYYKPVDNTQNDATIMANLAAQGFTTDQIAIIMNSLV